ncbi:MAG: hypothetical protein SGPRY_002618 [Prymnesium sp.]
MAACDSVIIVIAMKEEAMPLVDHFQLERLEPSRFIQGSPMVAWYGEVAGPVRLHVVWCGYDERFGVNNVATTAAAVSTYAAIAAFGKPSLLLSAAAGLKQERRDLLVYKILASEMECAAVAWVCDNLGVPFAAVKSITDIVDGEKATRAEFESNLHMASCALQERLTDRLGVRLHYPWRDQIVCPAKALQTAN